MEIPNEWQANELFVGFEQDRINVAFPPVLSPFPYPFTALTLCTTVGGLASLAPERRARLAGALSGVTREGARAANATSFIGSVERLAGRAVVNWAPLNFSLFQHPTFPKRLVLRCDPSIADGPWDELRAAAHGLGFGKGRLQDAIEAAIPAVWAAAITHTAHLGLMNQRVRTNRPDIEATTWATEPLVLDSELWSRESTMAMSALLGYAVGCIVDGNFDSATPSRYVREAVAACWTILERLDDLQRTLVARHPT